LEAVVRDLEGQLTEQEEDANNVISKWQESFTALDEQRSKLAQELEAAEKSAECLNGQLRATQLLLDKAYQNLSIEKEAEVKLQGVLVIVVVCRLNYIRQLGLCCFLALKNALPRWNLQWKT
jgi:septal ring factor EnvC (AmiA/AmiB activator)